MRVAVWVNFYSLIYSFCFGEIKKLKKIRKLKTFVILALLYSV